MKNEIDWGRRRFLGAAALTLAGADIGAIRPRRSESSDREQVRATPAKSPSGSLGPVKQINAGVLNVGYAEIGPADGRAVILMHGWPYDIHSYDEVAPALAAAGYRAIVPYLRGYGTTRFLSSETPRNGQPSVV